jgi:hypothetical protein
MKNTYIVIAALAVIALMVGVYYAAVAPSSTTDSVASEVLEIIDRPDLGVRFGYPGGVAGYSHIEQSGTTSTSSVVIVTASSTSTSTDALPPILRHTYVLLETPAYITYQSTPTPDSIPPAITVMIFDNNADQTDTDRLTKLKNWAMRNNALTRYEQVVGEPEQIEIDGVPSIRYDTTGVLPTRFTLTSYQGNIYLFAVQYVQETDKNIATYYQLLDSVLFY